MNRSSKLHPTSPSNRHHARPGPTAHSQRPLRLLVVVPSWVGDAVMATPTFRLLRELLPSSFIGALVRPGIEQVLAGTSFFDTWHIASRKHLLSPLQTAAMLRPRRYDTALLLTGSFSTALVTTLAGVRQRIGYARDARSFLLNQTLEAPRRRDTHPFSRSGTAPNKYAPVAATEYYFRVAQRLLEQLGHAPAAPGPLELACTRDEELGAAELLEQGGIAREDQRRTRLAILNPGGNNPAKRWPPDRFAGVADYLAKHHGIRILINGSPAEAELVSQIAARTKQEAHKQGPPIELPRLNITLGKLKGIIKRCEIMVTNDTGPRHIAAAFGIPVVSLFGPTDHRWTTIPFEDETIITADPMLPDYEVANDHPERCRIEKIGLGDVVAAANKVLEKTARGAGISMRYSN